VVLPRALTSPRPTCQFPRPHAIHHPPTLLKPEGDGGSEPSTSGSSGSGGGAADAAARQALERLFAGGGGALTGPELTELIRGKWGGRSFEARLTKRGQRVYLQVRRLGLAFASGLAAGRQTAAG
jgi:hypothetical protein